MHECIVWMEFRKNCLDCDLHQIVYGDSYADTDIYCFKEKRFVGKRFGPVKDLARPDWCPIICSIPEEHGRLVDADALKQWFIEQIDYYKRFDGPNCNMMVSAYEAVCRVINDAPTIVPAEAESPSPKPTDPVPIRDVYYVMTECDVKTGTVTYEPRERIEL